MSVKCWRETVVRDSNDRDYLRVCTVRPAAYVVSVPDTQIVGHAHPYLLCFEYDCTGTHSDAVFMQIFNPENIQ